MPLCRVAVVALLCAALAPEGPVRAQEGLPEGSAQPPSPTTETPVPPSAGEPLESPKVDAVTGDGDQAYQELVRAGVEAQTAGDFARAHAAFAEAHAIYPNARALRAMGVASFKAGAFLRAVGELEAALRDREKPLDERLRTGALELLARAQQEVSVVVLSVEPEAAQVFVDGQSSPQPATQALVLEPGPHDLRFSAAGYVAQTLGIQALKGARQNLSVVLAAEGGPSRPALEQRPLVSNAEPSAPSPVPHRRRVLGVWIASGVALASGVTAGGLYLGARRRIDSIADVCRNSDAGACTDAEKADQAHAANLPRLERAVNASLGLAVGSAVTALAVATWDYVASGRRIDLWLSHDTLTIRGSF